MRTHGPRGGRQSTHMPAVSVPATSVEAETWDGDSPEADAESWVQWLVDHRWLVVVPVVLPLSKLYGLYWRVRHVYLRGVRRNAERHGERVEAVKDQIEQWDREGRPGQLCTARKAWQSVAVRELDYKKRGYGIAVDMHDVLSLDERRGVVRVEPRVNMAQLTRFLVARGWTLPVVPELDDLTVGGLILGYGIESSSHKYGLFADTVLAMELVLADGRHVRCSREEHADLFRALPWSYGSLGILTAVELPVVPASSHVRVTYRPVQGLDDACAQFASCVTSASAPDFVDALFFSRDRAVIIEAEFAERRRGEPHNPIGRYYKPWFYKHAETSLQRGPFQDLVPLRDYYHRYTRSLFWHGELLVPFGNHPWFRYPFGWLMPPKVSFMRLVQSERIRRYRDARNVVQDALVPMDRLREAVELFHQEFECYPLWLCAHRAFRTEPAGMLQPANPAARREMFVDVGAWQVPGPVRRGEPYDARRAVRRVESWLRQHGGYQCLYAVTEQTRGEFWQMFHGELYETVRDRYGARGAFMDVFDKVARPERRST